MTGFKQAILDLSPKFFITFDGDSFDPINRSLLTLPSEIYDESGLGNKASLHVDNTTYRGYRLGMPSLVDLEPADQSAAAFGWAGAQPSHPDVWAKSWLEIPHSVDFAFPTNGSYSVSLMFNKIASEAIFRNYTGTFNYSDLSRTILSKGLALNMRIIDRYYDIGTLQVVYPAGTLSLALTQGFYNTPNHIAFTWEVVFNATSSYTGTATLYINSVAVSTASHTFFDTPPNTNVSTSWNIAGTNSASPVLVNKDDRATTGTIFDQVACFGRAISSDEVASLYKKTRTYENIIKTSLPSNYWTFADDESTLEFEVTQDVGINPGVYLGGNAKVLRHQSGPANIPGSIAAKFQDGGTASVHTNFPYSPIFNPTGDYSVEFWFTCTSIERGVILSIQHDLSPYNGILVQINQKNNGFSNGCIQYSINENTLINSIDGTFYNTGSFHHAVLVRRGSKIEMWLNGIKQSEVTAALSTITGNGSGQLFVMGMGPGRLSANGKMAHLALYPKALQPQEIRIRNAYAILYRVRGTVSLMGAPYRANIRVYKHTDGTLLQEAFSDPSDGTYLIKLADNNLVDLYVLNRQDRNVRNRAYGPITPALHEDLP